MELKEEATYRKKRKGGAMPALLKEPRGTNCSNRNVDKSEMSPESLGELVLAMGKRLQVEYVDGAIPYLREHEPDLWAELEALDQRESLEALLAYERLFFEGLRRYVSHLEELRQAA
ncbi:MAG: hypothetical protein ABSD47_15320 [Candidatus Methylomirabilota bacterium]|jgi:hypothetical protein